MKRSVFALTLCIALVGASAPKPISPSLSSRIDEIVRAALTRQHVAGASLAIVERGRIDYAMGYGLRNVDDALPVDTNTIFRIGSITKQFTAASIMLLQEQGKLRVDDPLSTYLPDAPHAREVTLRNLLSHTSGIVGYTEQPGFSAAVRGPATPAQIVATVAGKPLAFAPGTDWQYSNTNFILLGMVIEKVSGEPYASFVTQHFLRPLGMHGAMFWNGASVVHDASRGYTSYALGAFHHPDPWNYDWAGAAGALAMSASDLARWDVALDSGIAVSRASFAAMTTPQRLISGQPTRYGFGLGIGTFAGHRVVAHDGSVPGFITDNWTVPADGLAIVLLGNGDNFNPAPVIHQIAALLYGIPLPRHAIQPIPQPSADARKARALLADALHGRFDRAALDEAMTDSVTPDVSAAYAALGRRIGAPQTLQLVGLDARPPVTTYIYRVTFAGETLECELGLTDTGKLDDLTLSPWYDY